MCEICGCTYFLVVSNQTMIIYVFIYVLKLVFRSTNLGRIIKGCGELQEALESQFSGCLCMKNNYFNGAQTFSLIRHN